MQPQLPRVSRQKVSDFEELHSYLKTLADRVAQLQPQFKLHRVLPRLLARRQRVSRTQLFNVETSLTNLTSGNFDS